MDRKINRNDLCTCGSGKKFKKCCGANETVSITALIESEIFELQTQIQHFALFQYGDEILADFEDLEQVISFEANEEREFYQYVHSIWFMLFEPFIDGDFLIEKFMEFEGRKIKRPRVKEILQSWTEARTIAGKVLEQSGNTVMVESGLTNEKLEVKIDKETMIDKGTFFIGMIVPFEQKYVFFPVPFDLPDISPEAAFDYIRNASRKAGYADAPEDYLADFFIEVMHELPMIGGMVEVESLDWPAAIYQEIAGLFQRRLDLLGVPSTVIDVGIILWYQFCQKKQKRIQNPHTYVAALHYLLSTIVPMEKSFTQKELAELYGVSAGTLSNLYREMDDALTAEISQMLKIMDEDQELSPMPPVHLTRPNESIAMERAMQDVLAEVDSRNLKNIDQINDFLKQKLSSPALKKIPKEKKEIAQQLIYDAFEAEGEKRYKLAQEALELNPNLVDAYAILAETAGSIEERAEIYEKAMRIGEKELGQAFFEENKGYFWGMLETRPYMRAKLHFAESLRQLGELEKAVKQFEELLELNPNDNQGVRYELFTAYMEMGSTKKAGRLLKQYGEGSANTDYNKLLLELTEKGFTEQAKKLLKHAKKKNQFVIDYLTGKKRLPKRLPDYYGFGDENEAMVYADLHFPLWEKITGVKEWLTKQ